MNQNDNTSTTSAKPDRWLHLAFGCWFVVAIVLLVKGYVQPMDKSIFCSLVGGARDFWSGEEVYGRHGWYYGPTFATFFGLFSHLTDAIGAALWNVFIIALYFFALRRTYAELIAPRWPRIAESAFLLLVLAGSVRSLWSSQTNATIISCVLLGAIDILHRRWWRAALTLALTVHIKIWPIAPAGLLVAPRLRSLALRYAVCLAALAAAPLAVHKADYVGRYYYSWYHTLAERQATAERWGGYRDGWTLWETAIGPVDKRLYTIVQLSAAAAVLAYAVAVARKHDDPRPALLGTVGLWAAWQMLLGPGSERLTLVILSPCAAWLLLKSFDEQRGRTLAVIGCALTFVLGVGELERKLLLVTPLAMAALPAGVAVLGLALVWPHELARQALRIWWIRPASAA